jgi:CheY-like chemotaxis protein
MATTVLVVDDDADSRTVLVQYLTLAGLTTATATNGAEAIDSVRALHPEVVLMDLTMPVMGGMEAIGRIKADEEIRGTVVIVVTAHTAPALMEEARAAGAECGFVKPVDPRALLAAVTSLADLRARSPQ